MLPTMRLHGVIVEGGKAANIIPFKPPLSLSEYTKGNFIVRARKASELEKLKGDVRKCFEGAATSTRCKIQLP